MDLNAELISRNLEVLNKISSGHYGQVFEAKLHDKLLKTYVTIALKVCKTDKTDSLNKKTIHESNILEGVKFSKFNFCQQIIDSFYSKSTNELTFYLVLEYYPFCLHQIIDKRLLSRCQQKRIIAEMFLGLNYLKEKNIIHGDIKTDNIMINCKGRAVLIDFGLSNYEHNIRFNLVGTNIYTAPEAQTLDESHYSKSADYFAFGVVVLQIFLDDRFTNNSTQLLKTSEVLEVLKSERIFMLRKNVTVLSLLQQLLCVCYIKRLENFAMLKIHPFFSTTNFDYLEIKNLCFMHLVKKLEANY